jgi:hypothetical protein
MFPCLFQTLMCFIVVQDGIMMHPALHVSLGSTCSHISMFSQLLALVTCLTPDVSCKLSPSRLDSLHLPVKMHRLCSRNACSPLSFGLALHQITHPVSSGSTFRLPSLSLALRLSHSITLLPCSGPPIGLEGRPALSKKGAAVIAELPPWPHRWI